MQAKFVAFRAFHLPSDVIERKEKQRKKSQMNTSLETKLPSIRSPW